MAVDYAAKKWQRSNEEWALKNIKLRMSRKLLFAKGMLVCFLCDKHFSGEPSRTEQEIVQAELLNVCFDLCRRPAAELLAETVLKYAKPEVGKTVFSAYNKFLEMLDDADKRDELKKLDFGQQTNALFDEQRQNTRVFRDGLEALFFDSNPKLRELTRRYGVF